MRQPLPQRETMKKSLIDNLNEVCTGWTGCGSMICNPAWNGGIIDQAIVSKKWFVIFNNDLIKQIEGLDTQEDAVKAFIAGVERQAERVREYEDALAEYDEAR